MDYSAKLDHLQLQSLERRRRLIADLELTYRIIFGLIDLNMSDYFTLQSSSGYSRPTTTRGNPYKLLVNHCRINVRKHFLVSVLSEFGTVYRQVLLVFNHYCHSKIFWVMPTSVYTPSTERCFFCLLLSLYLVFKLLLFLCVPVLLLHVCFW